MSELIHKYYKSQWLFEDDDKPRFYPVKTFGDLTCFDFFGSIESFTGEPEYFLSNFWLGEPKFNLTGLIPQKCLEISEATLSHSLLSSTLRELLFVVFVVFTNLFSSEAAFKVNLSMLFLT
jgi:hypothetical protein